MEKYKNLIRYLGTENHFKYYLPIFRVFLGFHIIKKLYLNWGLISIVYNIYLKTAKKNFPFNVLNYGIDGIPVFIYLTIILSIVLIFGYGSSFLFICIFLLQLLNAKLFVGFANGGDNLLFFVLIYMIFTNSNYKLSISKYKESELRNLVSNLGAYCIILHLCLIYFVSGIHKLHTDIWFNGVAIYYILNLDRFCSPLNKYIANNAFIIATSTYFTLLFELLFPFLVWVKSTRNLFLVSGILLHLGIYFFMMIYDFEILFIMTYGFFLSNEEWTRIISWIKRSSQIFSNKFITRFIQQ